MAVDAGVGGQGVPWGAGEAVAAAGAAASEAGDVASDAGGRRTEVIPG